MYVSQSQFAHWLSSRTGISVCELRLISPSLGTRCPGKISVCKTDIDLEIMATVQGQSRLSSFHYSANWYLFMFQLSNSSGFQIRISLFYLSFYTDTVRSKSGFPHQALMARFSLFQTETLSYSPSPAMSMLR